MNPLRVSGVGGGQTGKGHTRSGQTRGGRTRGGQTRGFTMMGGRTLGLGWAAEEVLDRVLVQYVIMQLWVRAGSYFIGYVSS